MTNLTAIVNFNVVTTAGGSPNNMSTLLSSTSSACGIQLPANSPVTLTYTVATGATFSFITNGNYCISGSLTQYQVRVSTSTGVSLINVDMNMTMVAPQSVTIPPQTVDTVLNITVIAISVFNETLVSSAKAVYRPATIAAWNSSLILTPASQLTVTGEPVVVSVVSTDDAMMTQCHDSVSYQLAGQSAQLTKPQSLTWNTSIATVGIYTLNATYTNALGSFTVNNRQVAPML
jgi:hypothetical protein